jgi:hypothetical protein
VASFATLNAALMVIVAMVLLSQGWLSMFRTWVQERVG